MVEQPLLIRRPLMEADQRRLSGFDENEVDAWLGLKLPANAKDLETCPRQARARRAGHERRQAGRRRRHSACRAAVRAGALGCAFDPNLRIFDIILKTANGTSYNAYVIRGSEGVAVIDTVKEASPPIFLPGWKASPTTTKSKSSC